MTDTREEFVPAVDVVTGSKDQQEGSEVDTSEMNTCDVSTSELNTSEVNTSEPNANTVNTSAEPGLMAMLSAMMKQMNEMRSDMNDKLNSNTQKISDLKDDICEFRETLTRNIIDVETSAKQYTDEQCKVLKEEIKGEMKDSCETLKEEVKHSSEALKEEVKELKDSCEMLKVEVREEVKDSCEAMKTDLDEKIECLHRTVQEQAVALAHVTVAPHPKLKEEAKTSVFVGEGADETPLHTPPPSPRSHPAFKTSPQRFLIAPGSLQGNSHFPVAPSGQRKPSEFDGKVQWEAYFAQFQLLADAQGWDEAESALQLVASLRGPALEVLGHLTSTQRGDYSSVVEALRRKFGNYQQAEVYRARLKGRVRAKGESLPQLAQDIDTLVRRAFPSASEDMVGVLTTDHFLDALQNRELQLYVKQAHPKDVKEALARALEHEAFTRTSVGGWSVASTSTTFPTRTFHARRAQTYGPPHSPNKKKWKQQPSSGRSSPVPFQGSCYGCGQKGHKRSQCRRERRTRSLERPATSAFQPCCKSCGQYGHFSIACRNPKETVQAGNGASLALGAMNQPAMAGPLAL